MKSLTCLFLLLSVANLSAQKKETFDLATYTVPAGWKEAYRSGNAVGYAVTNNQKGTYCQLGVYASTASKGNLQADFASEWAELIVKVYKPSAKPELMPASSKNGWDIQGGVAPFEFSGASSIAMLLTASNQNRCTSVAILTNTEDYQLEIEKFIESLELKKIETPSPAQPVTNTKGDENIFGIWTMTATGQTGYRLRYAVMSYIKRQYTLYENGTYTFITKTYDPLINSSMLWTETGTFQMSGNNLTLTPQKSVVEEWDRKDNSDKWGKLLSTKNASLENVTYQFTRYYNAGVQEWQLILQAGTPTKRDGAFSTGGSFNNAYYYSPISKAHPLIELPAGKG